MMPISTSCVDHMGVTQARMMQWDGTKFVPKSDWANADQDVVWQMIRAANG